MNRMHLQVPSAAVVWCLLATGAGAQPLAPLPALPQAAQPPRVVPAPPAPAPAPAPLPWPGLRDFDNYKNFTPFDPAWSKDVAAMWRNAWPSFDSDLWKGAFSYAQGGNRGAAQTEAMEMAFSNPGSAGTIELHLFSGSVIVKGTNRKDVSIRVTHRGGDSAFERNAPPPPAGMRRLSSGRRGSLAVEEDNNRIEIRSRSVNAEMDLEIEVPVRTNLELRVVNGGDIAVEGVEGNLEVNNVNGPVRLTGVSGSVVASSVNANVTVRLTRVTDTKAMAFSSLSGTVDVTLPASTKANLKLRSDQGDVFTDFDVQQTDPPARGGWVRSDRGSRRARFETANTTVYGTINGGGPEIEARSFNGSVYIRKAQ